MKSYKTFTQTTIQEAKLTPGDAASQEYNSNRPASYASKSWGFVTPQGEVVQGEKGSSHSDMAHEKWGFINLDEALKKGYVRFAIGRYIAVTLTPTRKAWASAQKVLKGRGKVAVEVLTKNDVDTYMYNNVAAALREAPTEIKFK